MDDVITYLLIFSLVVLLCYTLFYLYNIYYGTCSASGKAPRAEHFGGEQAKRAVVIGSSRCGWTLKQVPEWQALVTTWTDSDRVKVDPRVCMIDQDTSCKELAERHSVHSYPTLLVLRTDGVLVSKSPGFKDRDALLRYLSTV